MVGFDMELRVHERSVHMRVLEGPTLKSTEAKLFAFFFFLFKIFGCRGQRLQRGLLDWIWEDIEACTCAAREIVDF